MMKTNKTPLIVAVIASGATLTIPTVGWSAEIDEIVVTSRKRSENLQDVPLSIEAFTAEEINRRSILTIADLSLNTPGLSVENQGGNGFTTPVIRGMAQNVVGTDLSYDNNVGIFMNGIYQSGRNSVDMELIGLDRIEVVRGPQSALYGRSTFAGAINYIYAAPTEEFKGSVSATIGTDEDYGGTFDVGGPLIADTLYGRISAGYREFDGTFKNLAGGDNLQGYESGVIAGALVYTPTDRLTATLNLLYSDRTNEQDAEFLAALNCGEAAFTGAPTYYCGNLDAVGNVGLSPNGKTSTDVQQYSLDLEYETDSILYTSITAYTESNVSGMVDRDYGALSLGTGLTLGVCDGAGCFPLFAPTIIGFNSGVQANADVSSSTGDFSQEFRISSVATEGISWMAGASYFDSDTTNNTSAAIGGDQLTGTESYAGFGGFFVVDDPFTQSIPFNIFEAGTTTWAVYGQVAFDVTEKLTATVEGRYTYEVKTMDISVNLFPVIPTQSFTENFDYISPRFTLEYLLNDDQMMYLSAAKGVRTGGINNQVTSIPADQAAERFFDPEDNWTYEIGSKNTFLDGRLLLNGALYYTDWSDTQLPALNSDLQGTHVVNVDGGVDVWGLELDVTALIGDMVTLTAGYAYTDPTFKDGTLDGSVVSSCGVGGDLCTLVPDGAGLAAEVGGQTLGRVAQNQLNVGLNVGSGLGDTGWDWYVQGNVNYQDKNYARSINTMTYGERTLVNMRIAVLNDNWEVALWGKNIFDEEYVASQALQPGFDGRRIIDAYQGNGSRFGLTGTYSF